MGGTGEVYLWITVIRETQLEAERGAAREQRLARRWLTTYSRSFLTVCAYAGLTKMQTQLLLETGRKQWKAH